jgi:hypothetical protein
LEGDFRHTLAMILIQRNYFVHRFFRGIAPSLRLLDLVRVSALLNNEVEYVEHFEILYGVLKSWFEIS